MNPSNGYVVARDALGAVVAGASLTVYRRNDIGEDDGLAQLSDASGENPVSNPVTSGADGVLSFWAAPGTYNLVLAYGAETRRRNGFPLPADPGGNAGKFLAARVSSMLEWGTPSGGGGGGPVAGPFVIGTDPVFEITLEMVQSSSIIYLTPGVTTLDFWDSGPPADIPGGICYVYNMSGGDVSFGYKSPVINAGTATGIKDGGLMQAIMPSGFSVSAYGLISGDLVRP